MIVGCLILFFSLLYYEGNYYDAEKAYVIVKDSIGLGIAILTPFIAIQIYNGWIKEHRAIQKEKITTEYYEKIRNMQSLFNNNPQNLSHEEVESISKEISANYLIIDTLSKILHGHDSESKEMITNLTKCKKDFVNYQLCLKGAHSNIYQSNYNNISSKLYELHNDIHEFLNCFEPLKIQD